MYQYFFQLYPYKTNSNSFEKSFEYQTISLFFQKVIEEQSAQVVIQRAPEDIELIQEQEQTIAKLQEDVNYIKQELIEARSHKAASDDELGNVKGQLETLQNNITSLSDEGIFGLFLCFAEV